MKERTIIFSIIDFFLKKAYQNNLLDPKKFNIVFKYVKSI